MEEIDIKLITEIKEVLRIQIKKDMADRWEYDGWFFNTQNVDTYLRLLELEK